MYSTTNTKVFTIAAKQREGPWQTIHMTCSCTLRTAQAVKLLRHSGSAQAQGNSSGTMETAQAVQVDHSWHARVQVAALASSVSVNITIRSA